MRCTLLVFVFAILLAVSPASAEKITLATYNIENFRMNFEALRMARQIAKEPENPAMVDLIGIERQQNDEDNWEVAQVILDPQVNPDIIVIQEGCQERDLRYFNNRWLKGAYETVIVFPTNTTRDQHLGLMLKPGFKVIERKDQYHLEAPAGATGNGERIFARGPAFALVESPSGYRFWVGTTHQKSKGDNSPKVAAWRMDEAKRTHQIMRELTQSGPADLVLLGDMNDELGLQEFEAETGGDVIAALVGSDEPRFVLATQKLAESGAVSYGGYWNDRYRAMIDHIVVSPSVRDQIEEVYLYTAGVAPVASDHYPLIIRLRADPTGPTTLPAARGE